MFSDLTTSQQKLLINVVALIILSSVISALTPNFLSLDNAANVLRNIATVVIVGAPFTMLMVTRSLDLSVGSVLALSGCVAALAASHLPVPLALMLGVGAGTTIGIVNSILTVPLRLNSVIATLGTLYVARGSALIITGGVAVYGAPEEFGDFGGGSILGLPNPVWVMLIVVAVFMLIERYTLLGRYSIAVGSNEEAAFLSGIPGARVRATLYVLTGTCAGLAGVLLASRLNSGQPNIGVGFEFDVIVATILGGTSLAGGEGRVSGMVIGALIVGVLANGLNLLGVPAFWQVVAQGVVLVLAVTLDVALRHRFAPGRSHQAVHASTDMPDDPVNVE